MDIYFAQDLAEKLGISEAELWRAYAAATTPEACLRRERRREAARPDGKREYVPVSLAGMALAHPDFYSRKVALKLGRRRTMSLSGVTQRNHTEEEIEELLLRHECEEAAA